MRFVRSMKQMLQSLAAPAEDPRETFPAPAARHQDLLDQVRSARVSLAASRQELEVKVTSARAKLDELAEGQAHDSVVQQLRGLVEDELRTLDGEIASLQEEERQLAIAEQRLSAQAQAASARHEALRAVQAAAEARIRVRQELSGLPAEIAELGDALEQAEKRPQDIQARASVIDRFADLGMFTGGQTFADPEGQRLAARYATLSSQERAPEPQRQLGVGFKALVELEAEYRQLLAVLAKRKETEPLSVSYVPSLALETYQQGLSVLRDALDLILAIRVPPEDDLRSSIAQIEGELAELGSEPDDAGTVRARHARETLESHRKRLDVLRRNRARVDELVHLGGRCAGALTNTRLELAALQAAGAGTTVDAVTETLRANLDQAREVQEEMKRLGL